MHLLNSITKKYTDEYEIKSIELYSEYKQLIGDNLTNNSLNSPLNNPSHVNAFDTSNINISTNNVSFVNLEENIVMDENIEEIEQLENVFEEGILSNNLSNKRKKARINKRKLLTDTFSSKRVKECTDTNKVDLKVQDNNMFTLNRQTNHNINPTTGNYSVIKTMMSEFLQKQNDMMEKWMNMMKKKEEIAEEEKKERKVVENETKQNKSKNAQPKKVLISHGNYDTSVFYKNNILHHAHAQPKRKETIKVDITKYKKNNTRKVLQEKEIKEEKTISNNKTNNSTNKLFKPDKSAFISKKQLNINKITPKELYKRSIDNSIDRNNKNKLLESKENNRNVNRMEINAEKKEKISVVNNSVLTHKQMIHYKPKKFIQTFSTESDLKDQLVTAKFTRENDLIEKVQKQHKDKKIVRESDGNKCAENIWRKGGRCDERQSK